MVELCCVGHIVINLAFHRVQVPKMDLVVIVIAYINDIKVSVARKVNLTYSKSYITFFGFYL